MNIRIDGETERLIQAALASGDYKSAEAFISAMVQYFAHNRREIALPNVIETECIEDLAAAQGVEPIRDFRDLKADFWPTEESTEEFLSAIRARREFDTPRVR